MSFVSIQSVGRSEVTVASPVTEATQLPFKPRARRWMSSL